MVDVSVKFDRADLDRFNKAMADFTKGTKKTPKDAVTWGGIKLLDSLGASTRIAKDKRKVYLPKDPKQKKWVKNGRKLFYVQFFGLGGKQRLRAVWASSKQAVLTMPISTISNRKLAKRSWGWAKHALFKKIWKDAGNRSIIKTAVFATKRESPERFSINIKNKLNYITDAFKTNGKMAVNQAMFRASKGMEKQIEKRLFKKGY